MGRRRFKKRRFEKVEHASADGPSPIIGLALSTSFGGLYDHPSIETCELIVITSAILSTSLSHRVPILANRAEILVNFLSFAREMRRISIPEA